MVNLFTTVFDMSVTATVVILVILALRVLLARAPKKYSYYLWAVAAFRLICPVSVSSRFSLFNLPVTRVREETVIQIPEETFVPAIANEVTSGVSQHTVHVTSNVTSPTVNTVNWAEMFSLIWVVGIAVVLLVTVIQVFRLRNKTRFAVRMEGNVWQSDSIPGPFVLGLFRPKIFLPVWLEEGQREYVLAHERYHIRRQDHWVKAVCLMILAVHWFNPFVWLMMWAVDRDMELSCDEGALKRLGENKREGYSRTLLSLAIGRRAVGPVLAFGTPAVKRRIVNVLRDHKATKITIAFAVAVLLIAGLTCCTDAKPSDDENYTDTLYRAQVEYVGDNSAVGNLVRKLTADSEYTFETMELHTQEEPYGISLNLRVPDGEDSAESLDAVDREAFRLSVMMLALVENLGYCEQEYLRQISTEEQRVDVVFSFPSMSVSQAEQILGISNLKSYGESPEKIEELLALIEQVDVGSVKTALILANAHNSDDIAATYFQYDGEQDIVLCLYENTAFDLRHSTGINATTCYGTWEQQDELLVLHLFYTETPMYFVMASEQELRYQKEMSGTSGLDVFERLPENARFVLVSEESGEP